MLAMAAWHGQPVDPISGEERVRGFVLAGTAVVAFAIAPPARAAQPAGGETPAPGPGQAGRINAYEAAFFAQFAPRTALDIVQHVPGFQLDLGNSDVRGFAGAVGNVVINGARPSSKSESLETLLSRIPASRVQRVEVGSGALYGADYAAKGQVLNLILSAASGFDGEISASANRDYTGHVTPNGEVTALLKRGDSSFNVSAGTQRNDRTEEGTDDLRDAATGNLLEHRRKINTIREHDPFVSGSWALEHGNDDSIHLNARWGPSTFYLEQKNHVTPVGGPERDDQLIEDYKTPVIELGGDISRPLGNGAIKFVGLATRRKKDNFDASYVRNLGGTEVVGGFEQVDKAKLQETIGRVSYSQPQLFGFAFETGLEVAYNKLVDNLDLFLLDDEGGRTRIDLPIDDATVSEIRGEAYVNAGRALSKTVRLDLGLRYEASKLKVRGDATADRTLRFLKPSITLDWRPGKGWHTQASLRRTVAQLDFYDFISSAELSSDRVNGGNADLQPQRTWETRLLAEKPILGDGLIKLQLGYDLVQLLQDRILTEDGFDAPGNLGTGRRAFADFTLDAPLSSLGLSGVRWKTQVTLQRTRVEDPIWHTDRRWTDYWPSFEWLSELRRDKGAFSYGIAVQDRDRFYLFRTDEIYSNWNGGPYGTAFVEYRPDSRTTIRFDADNIFDTDAVAHRVLYRPNRTNPDPKFIEDRERNIHRALKITVKRSFGRGSTGTGK